MSVRFDPRRRHIQQQHYKRVLDEFTTLFGKPDRAEAERLDRLWAQLRVYADTGKLPERPC